MIGARIGASTVMRRLVARAAAGTLAACVVPDARTTRNVGLDLPAAGLEVVANPRHASVLVVIGNLPHGLAGAAAVTYAQMPRPRAILALGADLIAPLPDADVTAAATQSGLVDSVARLRNQIAHRSWTSTAPVFTAPALDRAADRDDGGMDHGGMHGGHDTHAGMDHGGHEMGSEDHAAMPMPEHRPGDVAHDDTSPPAGHHEHPELPGHESMHHGMMSSEDHAGMDHGDMHHGAMAPGEEDTSGHEAMKHGGMDHAEMGSCEHARMNHSAMDHDTMQHGASSLDGMDHGMMGHDHHMMDGGFMSMIAMTRDLPRSRDGLPMEWVEAPFGPLFAGLPGGLAPTLILDGDTVARVTLTPGVMHRDITTSLRGPVATFPDRLAALDPWAPVAYRLLAGHALEAIDRGATNRLSDHGSIGALEQERAINHLGWLATFGEVLGAAWLAKRAAGLQLDLAQSRNVEAIIRLRPGIDRFLRDADRIPLLSRRLAGIAMIDPETATTAHGPVARASGVAVDARAGDPVYLALGFVPLLRDGGDALARFRVRLAEIGQSLDLVAGANSLTIAPATAPPPLSGTGMATIETPRGTASLHIEVDHGVVRKAHVQTSSTDHVALLPLVTEGAELADALVGIASLDLSPWEIDQ